MDQSAGMLSEDVQEKGYCLLCVAMPQTDCEIEVIEEVCCELGGSNWCTVYSVAGGAAERGDGGLSGPTCSMPCVSTHAPQLIGHGLGNNLL